MTQFGSTNGRGTEITAFFFRAGSLDAGRAYQQAVRGEAHYYSLPSVSDPDEIDPAGDAVSAWCKSIADRLMLGDGVVTTPELRWLASLWQPVAGWKSPVQAINELAEIRAAFRVQFERLLAA